jgi:hypothetical protein
MIGYVALAAVAICVFLFVMEPLIVRQPQGAMAAPARLADLRARRQYLLDALRDVDFDRASGKVGDEEYRETRARYLREAALVARELERENEHLDEDLQLEILRLQALASTDQPAPKPEM